MNFYPIHVKQGRTPQNTNAQRDLIVKTVIFGVCVIDTNYYILSLLRVNVSK